jgi:hypothetical protein
VLVGRAAQLHAREGLGLRNGRKRQRAPGAGRYASGGRLQQAAALRVDVKGGREAHGVVSFFPIIKIGCWRLA